MPRFGPIKRKDLLGYLKQLGFTGPYSVGAIIQRQIETSTDT